MTPAPSSPITSTTLAWNTAKLIQDENGNSASTPQIAIDTSGNALAVWQEFDGVSYNIKSNRYVIGTGWGAPELIETDNAGPASNPQIAVDANGNALAIWQQSDGAHENVMVNRYVVGTGWGTAQVIETNNVPNSGDALNPQIAFDANGNALAVWSQDSGVRVDIMSNRYVAGIGWGTAEPIETNNAGDALNPQIAIDANGNALAVWEQSDGMYFDIWSNRYTAGMGWGTAQLIEFTGISSANHPQIAMNASGNAVAVWEHYDGSRFNIWAASYTLGTGWGTEQMIEIGTGTAKDAQVAIDSSGNALAVWSQSDGVSVNIMSNRYMAGTGWGMPQLIETEGQDAFAPHIAMDANGNAMAIWYQNDGFYNSIRANRYAAGTGWGNAELIETENMSDASDNQIAVNANGIAMAVWFHSNTLWGNRFD